MDSAISRWNLRNKDAKGIRFKHKMFKNTGHAELVHKNPQRLVSLIERAYNSELY